MPRIIGDSGRDTSLSRGSRKSSILAHETEEADRYLLAVCQMFCRENKRALRMLLTKHRGHPIMAL